MILVIVIAVFVLSLYLFIRNKIQKAVEDNENRIIKKQLLDTLPKLFSEFNLIAVECAPKLTLKLDFSKFEANIHCTRFKMANYTKSFLDISLLLVEEVKTSYLNLSADFNKIPHINWDIDENPKFWENELKYRETTNGRSPHDWNTRRELVFQRDQESCFRCGLSEKIDTCHIHHIVRRAHGGNHALDNLVTLCKSCHVLMDGHDKMKTYTKYRITKKTIHTLSCKKGRSGKVITTTYGNLREKNYNYCKICNPWEVHENKKSAWRPEIEWKLIKYLKHNVNEIGPIEFPKLTLLQEIFLIEFKSKKKDSRRYQRHSYRKFNKRRE